MTIATLIDKVDNVELVRDKLAEILVLEVASQKALALAASPTPKDPRLWDLRVFVDRSNPWADYIDAETGDVLDAIPVVNISLDSETFDARRGDTVERQTAAATFNVDVYGYGVSEETDDGHTAGDARAKAEALRAMRLVRNILMSAEYTYLGLRGIVARRWPSTITLFDIEVDSRTVAHVCAARLELAVDLLEFSPQVQGEALELISINVARRDTNEIYLRADYSSVP